MGPVFFDTWGWVAIVHQEDEYHEKAAKWYKEFLAEDPIVITSDVVLTETFHLLLSRCALRTVLEFTRKLKQSIEDGDIHVEVADPSRLRKAFDLMEKYKDHLLANKKSKPLSLTDCTSFVIMQELAIKEVLTGDRHFHKVGMGFVLVL